MSATSGQIMRPVENKMTEQEFRAHFLEIIRPLHYTVLDHGNVMYLKPKDDKECARGISLYLSGDRSFIINNVQYYCDVYFEFIWDDERYEPEDMNSDMALAITNEYMKVYPDALFHYEGSADDSMFMDKTDIDAIISKPFIPGWYYLYKTHLSISRVNKYGDEWTIK